MNRDEVKELMPILQAFLDHKELRRKHGMSWVNDHDDIHLDQEYRIKPEPRVFWINPSDMSRQEDKNDSPAWWLTQEEYESGKWDTKGYIKTIEDLSDD